MSQHVTCHHRASHLCRTPAEGLRTHRHSTGCSQWGAGNIQTPRGTGSPLRQRLKCNSLVTMARYSRGPVMMVTVLAPHTRNVCHGAIFVFLITMQLVITLDKAPYHSQTDRLSSLADITDLGWCEGHSQAMNVYHYGVPCSRLSWVRS